MRLSRGSGKEGRVCARDREWVIMMHKACMVENEWIVEVDTGSVEQSEPCMREDMAPT